MLLVTGANGFIGSAMVYELNQSGHKDILCVDPVDQTERPHPLKNLKYSHFCNEMEVFDWINSQQVKLTGIFHMGACSTTTETNEEYLRKTNTDYSKKIWQLSIQHDCQLIYASSAATYGNGDSGFDDTKSSDAYEPLNLYGWSKLWFDQWVDQQTERPKNWYGLRFFNVFGPQEYHKNEMSSVAFKAFQQIRETGKLKLFRSHNPDFKDGEQLRDFVYVKDVTRWMLELFEHPETDNGIYNMGFGKCRTWIDLANGVFSALGAEQDIDWIDIPENIRNQYQYFTEAKMDKWYSQNRSEPQWSLEAGIEDYVKNYLSRKNPYFGNNDELNH